MTLIATVALNVLDELQARRHELTEAEIVTALGKISYAVKAMAAETASLRGELEAVERRNPLTHFLQPLMN